MFSLIYVFPLIFISFFESYWEAVNNILVPLNYYLWENIKKNMDLSLNEGGKNINRVVGTWEKRHTPNFLCSNYGSLVRNII